MALPPSGLSRRGDDWSARTRIPRNGPPPAGLSPVVRCKPVPYAPTSGTPIERVVTVARRRAQTNGLRQEIVHRVVSQG
jgi:hypothetical protein